MEPQFQVSSDPDEVVMKQHLDGTERPFLFITNFVMPGVGNWVRCLLCFSSATPTRN